MIHYADDLVTLHHGDCLDVLRELPDASVDAVVTDPPYGLEFMGKAWDGAGDAWRNASGITTTGYSDAERLARPSFSGDTSNPTCASCGGRKRGARKCDCTAPEWRVKGKAIGNPQAEQMRAFGAWCEQWATECLRVLKPGGHLLAFGGTRTWHRLACAVEDAGFEVRDSIAWLYGSGFPKSLDVSKAIDKAAGATREVIGRDEGIAARNPNGKTGTMRLDGFTTVEELRAAAERGDRCPNGRDAATTLERLLDRDVAAITAPATDDARTWQGWGTAMKPAHEPCVLAVKPLSPSDILASIGSHLDRLGAECESLANGAAQSSPPTRVDAPAARTASAPASAATPPAAEPARTTQTGPAVDSSAATDTSVSESTVETCSNTVTSWRACWVELCEAMSTSTIATTSETTTALRTLSSLLSRLTAASMAASASSQPGSTSTVTAVDNLFASVVFASRATLALSAAEPATSSTPPVRPDEAAPASTAYQPVVVARKPLSGTVAANVLAHGTGALNIDGCRVATNGEQVWTHRSGNGSVIGLGTEDGMPRYQSGDAEKGDRGGRWPANVTLSEEAAAELDRQSGTVRAGGHVATSDGAEGTASIGPTGLKRGRAIPGVNTYSDSGGASRFFYVAKAPTRERPKVDGVAHPTVKPLALMRWLVRLVTPPGGTVLEPFAGSGTTVEACVLEGFHCIAIEREAEYLPLIQARLDRQEPVPDLGPTVEDRIVEQVIGQLDLLDDEGAA